MKRSRLLFDRMVTLSARWGSDGFWVVGGRRMSFLDAVTSRSKECRFLYLSAGSLLVVIATDRGSASAP